MNILLSFIEKCKGLKLQKIPTVTIFKEKRCDPQSKCAECTRKLLAILHHFHSTYMWYKINDNHEKSFEYLEIIMALLDLKFDSRIPGSIHLHTDMTGAPKNDFIVQERYLSQYKCNKLALMILKEALFQFQDSVKHGKFDINDQSIDAYVLESIETLKEMIQSREYSSKTNIESIDEKLRIYTYKFEGNGVKYLKELSESKLQF